MIINKVSIKEKYVGVLQTLKSLPFNVGMNLLVQVLQGNETNAKIQKLKLQNQKNFGILQDYTKDEIIDLTKTLLNQNFIMYKELPNNRWIKVLHITDKGKEEIKDPKGFTEQKERLRFESTPITESEEKLITSLRFLLEKYNKEQSQAIISKSSQLLCVAGAGSGKTTVLTKRIEFLCKFKSTQPSKILAITFTKKAKREMQERLTQLQVYNIDVETFNSFAEKIFQKHWNLIYSHQSHILAYRDKIKTVVQAIKHLKTSFNRIAPVYFTTGQRKIKTNDQLLLSFTNDVFHVIDHYKSERKTMVPFHDKMVGYKEKTNAKTLHDVCVKVSELLKQQNLRDYSDQVKDAITIFKMFPDLVPKYEHILVDEYQDVNKIQIELLGILNSPNLFVVGDPRQSIFGWRGSRINYILEMGEDPKTTTVVLKQNYRSHSSVVGISNRVIKKMAISDQEIGRKDEEFKHPHLNLFNFARTELERQFIVREIQTSPFPKQEIFVLARTNRQLVELSKNLKNKNIPHILKTDETKATEVKTGSVTLATIHAIKGLEAEVVFVMGSNSLYFPCRVSDHPVIESLNLQDYNKEEEERRLFYVAVTRAKQQLYISYTGKALTPFLDKESRNFIGAQEFVREIPKVIKYTGKSKNQPEIYASLKDWRSEICRVLGVPAYMILNNKSIEELSQAMPINKRELHDIFGLGPRKIEKYGEEILTIING